jgi:glyoxylase-like metal-dependent hydrolase (beta-lactamase superfamily II)
VDTGNSPFMSPKLLDIYGVDFTTYTIEGSLQRLGVRTDDVTDVILTHLHFDHAGGAVVERDGEHLPRFSNATYHVQREHLQWALQPSLKDRASFMPEYYQPLIDHGRLSLVDGEGELFPHIHVHTVHGHTPFMQVLHVGGEEGVFYAADLIPTSAHVPLPYGMAYDNEPLKTIEEKQRFHPRMVEERWTVIFEHDALRQASRIVMGEKGVMLGDDVVITSYE